MPPAEPDTFVKRIARRSLRDAGLDGSPVRHFKQDHRSEVWAVRTPDHGQVVVKRFAYPVFQQWVSLSVGLHPGQLELRQHRKLHAAGVPVVTIFDAGYSMTGPTPGLWLATPWIGDSLQHHIVTARPPDAAQRLAPALDAAAALTRTLLDAGFAFKDLKPSNLVLDAQGRAHLLDAGSARRSTSPARIQRMLTVMRRVLRRDQCPDPLITRYLDTVGIPLPRFLHY